MANNSSGLTFQKKKFPHNGKGGKQSFLKSKANAASGYARRHSLKDKKREQDTGDVYEYEEQKTRRSKVRMNLDRDEAQEFGGLDGMDDSQREALRARLIGENDDDEKVDSDDDEEIDSDAAFEENDEERFAEFFPAKKKKSKSKQKERNVRFAEVDLNEDDEPLQQEEDGEEDSNEEEKEGDPDEFIDLLDVLDGKGEIDIPSDNESAPKEASSTPSRPQHDSDDEVEMDGSSGNRFGDEDEEMEEDEDEDEDEDGEDEEEEDQIQITASDEEDEMDESNLENLQSFVASLDTTAQKRKAVDEVEPTQKRKRRILQERTEAGAEDEFRVNASGSKLNLDDFLAPLASQSSSLMTLKKATKVLGSSSKAKTLSAPLPQRAQEKLDREAAYEQTKEEVDKWNNTMKRIREAEHLSFPLQVEKAGRVSNLELTAKFKPSTTLESAVDRLLKSARVREEDINETEEGMLKANNLSVEEVAQRRAELRKMRELMYRAEVKAKRVKKIKSKTYRKIKRKEKERLAEQIDEENSDDEDAQMKREMERARERATLRHKHTGKWARQMRSKHMDEDQKKEIEEMLDKSEKLRRKIQGIGSDESEEENESSDDDDLDPEEAMEKIKADTFDELQKLRADGSEGGTVGKKGKSVFEMKFMKDAMARQQAVANKEVDDFLNELSGTMNVDDEEYANEVPEHDPSSGVVVQRVGGRVTYRPGAPSTSKVSVKQAPPPPSDTSSVTLKSTDLQSPAPVSPVIETSSKPSGEFNPWLAGQNTLDESTKISRKKNEVVVNKDSKAVDKAKNKLKKDSRNREEEKQQAKDDATLEISMDNVLQLQTPSQQPSSSSQRKKGKAASAKPKPSTSGVNDGSDDDDSGANSEVEAQEQELVRKSKGKGKAAAPTAFQQRDLVAMAFAGDNVVREFEEAKRREIADDAPQEVDTTIPGWGSWGGAGMKKKPPKPERIKKIAGVDPTTRADYNKKHIIISEKRDKKAAKYLVKDLPYPYTSQAQFERTMERPLGAQWNTRVAFQRATLPRVVKKPGVVTTPLTKSTT